MSANAPTVAVVAYAHRNASGPGDGGCLERILQQNGAVESMLFQTGRDAQLLIQAAPAFGSVVRNQLIAKRLPAIETGYPGASQDGNVCSWVLPAQRL